MEFLIGGLSSCGAVLVTNPLEVAKTRIQLQGELQARGCYPVHYRNVFHALFTIGSRDGVRAIQSGLAPAMCYQFCQNGFRLGAFQLMENSHLTKNEDGSVNFPRSVLAGAAAGSVGAFLASPLYMIKTQLQSSTRIQAIAVGFQHRHVSMSDAVATAWSNGGLRGLWRGASAATLRVSAGSSVQLSTFSKARSLLLERFPALQEYSMMATFLASLVSGSMLCVIMTPFDVVCTRLYNQGIDRSTKKGMYYDGVLDCFGKIFRSEGLLGFYKGVSAAISRCAPHTVITLMLWQALKDINEERLSERGAPPTSATKIIALPGQSAELTA
ncbi:solute carrier family 25 member 35 [Galendromus occidentalis]|uniref:Solute carrier family 25 member 35 n=1 Tax=Galendromus occidentalis TaxID=34638 RepID=A0AAJ6QW10_9ACAR|nr:solute carrier family 25 member 35 [Galendromus occidentalis]